MALDARKSIVIACMGTRGDIQPFVALGITMQRRGWEVTMAAPVEFQDFINSFQVLHYAFIPKSVQVRLCIEQLVVVVAVGGADIVQGKRDYTSSLALGGGRAPGRGKRAGHFKCAQFDAYETVSNAKRAIALS